MLITVFNSPGAGQSGTNDGYVDLVSFTAISDGTISTHPTEFEVKTTRNRHFYPEGKQEREGWILRFPQRTLTPSRRARNRSL